MSAAPDLPNVVGRALGSGTSLTFSVKIQPGDNWLIVSEGNRQGATASVVTPSSITFNGIALTLLAGSSSGIGTGSTSVESSTWHLQNPPTGTYSLVVTYAVSANGVGIIAIPCYGVTGFGTPTLASSTSSNVPLVTASGGNQFGFYLGSAFNGDTSQNPNGAAQSDLYTLSSINSLNSFSASQSPNGAFSWSPTGTSNIAWYAATALAVLGADVQASVPHASPSVNCPF